MQWKQFNEQAHKGYFGIRRIGISWDGSNWFRYDLRTASQILQLPEQELIQKAKMGFGEVVNKRLAAVVLLVRE